MIYHFCNYADPNDRWATILIIAIEALIKWIVNKFVIHYYSYVIFSGKVTVP